VKAAMFQTPFMSPSRTAREVFTWAVDQAIACDQAGVTEYWVGEHASQSWECIPNPELVIAAAANQTERIVLAPGAHILPYHNPASTAIQIAWLSQILEGRYMLGVGAGAYAADGWIRGHKDLTQNHDMLLEALDILEMVWRGEPFLFEGKHFRAGLPEEDPGHPFRRMTPPGPIQLGLTGLSPNSESIRFAGQRGALPLSIYCGDQYVRNHWETFSTAAEAAGHTVDRSWHHIVRDVLVADTDAEARRLAIEGGIGRAWGEYLLPIYSRFGILDGLVKHPGMAHADVTLEYLAEHVWIVGSVDTVVRKFDEFQAVTGGFGTIMAYGHDYIDQADAWNESLRLLAQEVVPRVTDGY
jgi:alkanesulfonate monooxygenase SsuD/methylene tetrahydromethanopterin reductase-like flavin-dependent oxidoreductase (luciferase family)